MRLKIETVGDELGVMLPQELIARLRLDQGAAHLDAEMVGGSLHLLPPDQATEPSAQDDGIS